MNLQLKELIRSFLPRSIRPYRIQSGFLRGRVLYTSLHDYPAAIRGTTETELVAWLRANVRSGDTWLDVGAHYGYISLALAFLTGREGRVFAFEPMLTTAGFLNLTRQANDLPQLVILPFALGNSPASHLIRLPVTRGMADSTLEHPDRFENILEVQFDVFWKNFARGAGDGLVSGVKIDVQGMELETLNGMRSLLELRRPKVVLEFHRGVDRGAVISLLSSCGYTRPGLDLSTLQPVDALNYLDNQSYLFLPVE